MARLRQRMLEDLHRRNCHAPLATTAATEAVENPSIDRNILPDRTSGFLLKALSELLRYNSSDQTHHLCGAVPIET
jgi:hypothetical protein